MKILIAVSTKKGTKVTQIQNKKCNEKIRDCATMSAIIATFLETNNEEDLKVCLEVAKAMIKNK